MVKLFLKYFLNDWNFIKVILKPSFCQLAHFTRKLVMRVLGLFLDKLFEYMHCMVILMLVGDGCHTLGGESVKSVWLDCHGDYEVVRWCTFGG